MEKVYETGLKKPRPKEKKITAFFKKMYRQRFLFLITTPFVIWLFIFAYIPLWGWTMAFQEYQVGESFFKQQWVGLAQFRDLFSDDRFYLVLKNTIGMSLLGLFFGTIIAITFAILLNEIISIKFKRIVQTVSYLPHFVSWVVAASIISNVLSIDGGVVNEILLKLHLVQKPIMFLSKPELFWGINTISGIWKEMGWSAIIYLAAISGVDPSLYEAAEVDGAGRFRKIWHVTLPGIRPTIIILLVLSIGNMINIGMEQQFLLENNSIKDAADVLDIYALNYGIGLGRYSFGTAINIFKSVVGLVLVFTASRISKIFGEGELV
jgi:putative aldouronate transport system permease protein